MTIKIVLILLLAVGAAGFVWLKKHDEVVRWRALAEQRADSLEAETVITEGLRKAVTSLDSSYARSLQMHTARIGRMNDSVKVLTSHMRDIAAEIADALPDSSKHLADDITTVCNEILATVRPSLEECGRLRTEAESTSNKKTAIILRVTNERDGYKKLYEEGKTIVVHGPWEIVGKGTALVAATALITKLVGLW